MACPGSCFAKQGQGLAWNIDTKAAKEVKLSGIESGFFVSAGEGVGTITFYEGSPVEVKAFLQDRTRAIVEANPWLGGMVVKKGGVAHMVYEDTNPHPHCFKLQRIAKGILAESTEAQPVSNRTHSSREQTKASMLGSNVVSLVC
eukprot:TRINITY_DN19012_c0_g1_i5.p1 TRINITY_DN19012_c0_g1~~TRINITY_DN19012_c0_g1_i5.p1  ORF type:complete len:145 (-),score=15.23 TRINITY_DN19012_c0_g1_i5:150-584(-)